MGMVPAIMRMTTAMIMATIVMVMIVMATIVMVPVMVTNMMSTMKMTMDPRHTQQPMLTRFC